MVRISVASLCVILLTLVVLSGADAYMARHGKITTYSPGVCPPTGCPPTQAMQPPAGYYPYQGMPAHYPKPIVKCKRPPMPVCLPPTCGPVQCGPPPCRPMGCAPPPCGPVMCAPPCKRPVVWY